MKYKQLINNTLLTFLIKIVRKKRVNQEYNHLMRLKRILILFIFIPLLINQFTSHKKSYAQINLPFAKYIILMIGDGMGANHLQAANIFTNQTPDYETWKSTWVSTYPTGGDYDPQFAWVMFEYVKSNFTDSAAAATALYTGSKTDIGKISVNADGSQRLTAITDIARARGMAVGAVTTAPISDATPGAWIAHNDSRTNGYAILDEALWGNPNTTGDATTSSYGGGHGITLPPINVLIGGGHPDWFTTNNHFVNATIVSKLKNEDTLPGSFHFVERIKGSSDGGQRLLTEAQQSNTTKLVGLFGGTNGDIEYRLSDGSGANPENPTLSEMARAALATLEKNPNGFILLIEGGTIDHASHANKMNEMLGEVIGFNEAVQEVENWVNDPNNVSNWENTLVIITADHETGYLTVAPGAFPDKSLGEISNTTLFKEKTIASTQRRASWEDQNNNNEIDPGETVYWAWNSSGHTNSLVPLFISGTRSKQLDQFIRGNDPIRGNYIDNTDVFLIMRSAMGYIQYFPIIYSPYISASAQ